MDARKFESKNWNKLTTGKKLAELQKVEKEMARLQNRAERTIVLSDLGGNTLGAYRMQTPDKLYINKEILKGNVPYSNYQALNTVIHEGRHAWQDDIVNGKILDNNVSMEQINDWRINSAYLGGVYNKPDIGYTEYRFQPKELDANQYASGKLDELGINFKNDKAYLEYVALKAEQQYRYENVAKLKYGNEFQKVICENMHKDYQQKVASKQIEINKEIKRIKSTIHEPNMQKTLLNRPILSRSNKTLVDRYGKTNDYREDIFKFQSSSTYENPNARSVLEFGNVNSRDKNIITNSLERGNDKTRSMGRGDIGSNKGETRGGQNHSGGKGRNR